jgi:DNA polymerase (family 10)
VRHGCHRQHQKLLQGTTVTATNAEIAELLRRYAATLVLEGADRFKVKAYRKAADTLEGLETDVARLVSQGEDLKQLPGIGQAISKKIEEIVTSGKLTQLERTIAKLKPELVELANHPALDPKKVQRVYKKLGINSLAELRERLARGEIRELFGPRIDFHIRQGLDERPRALLWSIESVAARIDAFLARLAGVSRFSRAGSLRRKQDTVGDLNYVVTGGSAKKVLEAFGHYPAVRAREDIDKHQARFWLPSGIAVQLTWISEKDWGVGLIQATGSAAHLQALEAEAKRALKGRSRANSKRSATDETHAYASLGLEYIEPELREGRGEVEAAREHRLPELIKLDDLRGDLHMHTTASDGANSLEEMVEAAQARGYEYIAITDHSQSLKITNGLTERRLLDQIKVIDKLNARLKKFKILKSAEVDILEDGRLDYSNAVLRELDVTVCSIHSRFSLNRQQQTDRILRAMDNPYFSILGHATGRLLLRREGYEIDIERLIQHARAVGCYFEINSSPDRLDLSDEHALLVKQAGVKIAINTDAHSIRELDFISAGINQARRGWLTREDVLNTLPLSRLRKALQRP